MSLSLLLLLMVGSSQASHFLGTVITYYPKDTFTNGSVQVVLRYKTNFKSCGTLIWACLSGVCGNESLVQNTVDTESSGEWCQQEGKSTRLVPTNAPFQLHLDGGNWIGNIQNVTGWKAVILVELRNRSDTGKANTSPQTTILPLLRVPSNCSRDFNLLAFDPDGDEVVCRHANDSNNECKMCTAPSFLNLSSSCSLSFSPTSSSDEGSYAVQLMMEDFPRQTISLTQTDGSQVQRTTSDSITKIPIQFVFRVDSAVPSCTEGLYLPRFLPPTPANREQLSTQVNQPLEISIKAEASVSSISELLFSGPYNTDQETLAAGDYVLRWTPSEDEVGESHPICFVVQANLSSMKYQSELRCVIVTVTPGPTTTTQITTTTPTTTQITTTTTPTTNTPTTATPTTTTQITTTTPTTTQITTTTTPTTTTPTTTQITTTTTPTTNTPITTTTPTTTQITTTTTPTTTTPTTTTQITTTTTPTTTPTTTTQITTTTPTTTQITTTTTPTTTTPTTTPTTTQITTTTTPTTTTPTITTPTTTTPTTTFPPVTNTTTDTTASPSPVTYSQIFLKMRIKSAVVLSEEVMRNTVLQQITDELVKRGLPGNFTLRLINFNPTTTE